MATDGATMIEIERQDDGLAVLRLAHGKVNALDLELLEAIRTGFGELIDATAIVLTGAGSSFSAGVDLQRIERGSAADSLEFLDALSATFRTVFAHPAPVVAAINGHAIAGGAILAFAADRRLMSGGMIGLSELKVGVSFPAAATEIARYVAGAHTQRLMITAELFDPARATGLHLTDRVVAPEELLDAALHEARTLTAIPAETYALTKRALHAPVEAAIDGTDPQITAAVRANWATGAGRQGITAFLEQLRNRRG